MDWDDYRIFLHLANAPSVRAAANRLQISHSTVLRRIDRLETKLETRLFDRNAGFSLTPAGSEVLAGAKDIEESIQSIDRSVTGRDSALNGEVKITMPDAMIHPALIPDFKKLRQQFPGITIRTELSYETLDLRKREADIAVRITDNPPDDVVARKVGTFGAAAYATKEYVEEFDPLHPDSKAELIGWGTSENWVTPAGLSHLRIAGHFDNILLQTQLTLRGAGVGILPIPLAELEPSLVKLSDALNIHTMWVIYHSDLRYTSRVRVVRDFLLESFSEKLAKHDLSEKKKTMRVVAG